MRDLARRLHAGVIFKDERPLCVLAVSIDHGRMARLGSDGLGAGR